MEANKARVQKIIDSNRIEWNYCYFTKSPPLVSKAYDLIQFKRKANRLCKFHQIDFIHCRSYVACEVGRSLKLKYGLKYLFDMRGFWVDERKDAKIWNVSKPLYKLIYDWYKRKEKALLKDADAIITLTNAAKIYIQDNFVVKASISVIPCAADLSLFKPQPLEVREHYRTKLKLGSDTFVLVYLGSIGTWYMLDEMLDFFSTLKLKKKNAKFLFVSNDDPEIINEAAIKRGIGSSEIIIIGSRREDVPKYVSVADATIFFIKDYFSKTASSPTKHGELLGCEIPIICNNNIGDLAEITARGTTGIVINEFNEKEYADKLEIFLRTKFIKSDFSSLANTYYSIEEGIDKYSTIYRSLTA